jgi:hypothetical protein
MVVDPVSCGFRPSERLKQKPGAERRVYQPDFVRHIAMRRADSNAGPVAE